MKYRIVAWILTTISSQTEPVRSIVDIFETDSESDKNYKIRFYQKEGYEVSVSDLTKSSDTDYIIPKKC